jgi:hypothetical protein
MGRQANGYVSNVDVSHTSLPIGIKKWSSSIMAVLIIMALVFGYVASSMKDVGSSSESNSGLGKFVTGLSLSTTKNAKSTLNSISDVLPSKASAALSGDCTSSAKPDDADGKAASCTDSMLDTKLNNSSGDDSLIAKDANGNSCPSIDYVVNSAGKCVDDNTADTSGTIKSNPGGFLQKVLKQSDTYQDSTPSLIDILSMVVNRIIEPGYYINSDFQNYSGDGNKVAPYSGSKGSPADIGKASDERTEKSKNSSPSTAHMYAWRDMECKTGLTDQITGKTGTPTLNTSNCDIPNIGTEAIQDLASLVTATGLQNADKTSAKTAFGLGYAGDLLPTDGVPTSASDRRYKYTAMELFGYNLKWTSYAGEFDHIKVMTNVRLSTSMSLGNALKVAGNALASFGTAIKDDAAHDWGEFTDRNNDWWTRTKGFFGFINPWKHLGAGFAAGGYSLFSDLLYSIEAGSTVAGSWYRPDFVSQTVYGVRELTSIEKTALTSFKAKAAMWSEIANHTLDKLDFAAYYSEHAIPDAPKTKLVRPDTCDDEDKEDKKNTDGTIVTDPDTSEPERQCKQVQKLETWAEYKNRTGIDDKANAIGLNISNYDGITGDANAKYQAISNDWNPAMKKAAANENQKIKENSYNNQIGSIINTAVKAIKLNLSLNSIGDWYCVDDQGNPKGHSQNYYIQMAVSQGIMSDPGLEAFKSDGTWQCSSTQPRPTIIGGLYGSSHKGNDNAYKDTRRQAYEGFNLFDLLIGNKMDEYGQRMLGASQNVVIFLNTLVGWSFEPILTKLGFTDLVKNGVNALRDSVYMQFIAIIVGLAGLMIIIKLVRGQPIAAFQQIGMVLLAVFLGSVLLFNTDLMFKAVDDLPTAVERAAIGTIFNGNDKDQICDATGAPKGTLGAGSFRNLDGTNTGYNPDAQIRVLQCKVWETFVLTPWSYGQFGVSANQLWATGYSTSEGQANSNEFNINQATQDVVGTADVNMGGGVTLHNWAIYQLAHTTSGTISTADKTSAKTVDKNMYRLVDLQAGPNNGAGRDASHWDTWRGATNTKFVIGLTALPAAILGLIAIGGLALKKIRYTVMVSLLLLASPFVFLIGAMPGSGWNKMKTYLFDIASNIIKRILSTVFLCIALVIMLEVADGPSTSWTVAVIGIYVVCLSIMFYADELMSNVMANIDSKAGDWKNKENAISNAISNNTFTSTMRQNAHDIFVGGTGAAIGLILAGNAGDENSRSKVRGRLNKQISGVNSLMKRDGDGHPVTGGDGIIKLDVKAVTAGNNINFKNGVGSATQDMVGKYNSLMALKGKLDGVNAEANSIRRQLRALRGVPGKEAERARLTRELAAINENKIIPINAAYQAKRKQYLVVQNAMLRKMRLQKTMNDADLTAQLNAARGAGGAAAGAALKSVVKNKMDLAKRERNRHDVYDKNGLTVQDISLASEASFRISRIMNRSRLSRLRNGQSNFLLELDHDMDTDLDNRVSQSQLELMAAVDKDNGFFGTDEYGKPITSLREAIGINDIDDNELRRIITSTANPMMLQADIDMAMQNGDWRQVRAEVGDILNNEQIIDHKINDWGYDPEDIEFMVNAQLAADDKDVSTATLRDENIAREKVMSNIESSSVNKIDEMKMDLATANVTDRFEAERRAALKEVLGPEYTQALAEEATPAGQRAIRSRMMELSSKYEQGMRDLKTQEEAIRTAYGDINAYAPGSDERKDYETAMRKIAEGKSSLQSQYVVDSHNVSKSKAMEASWRDTVTSKIDTYKKKHESGEMGDRDYENKINETIALSAAVKTAENQIITTKKAQQASGILDQTGREDLDIARNIENLKSERTTEAVNLSQLQSEATLLQDEIEIKTEPTDSMFTSVTTVHSEEVMKLKKELDDNISKQKEAQSQIEVIKKDIAYQMKLESDRKNDILNDTQRIVLPDGSIVDNVAKIKSLQNEAMEELRTTINGSDDSATRAIKNSNSSTAGFFNRMVNKTRGVEGARLATDGTGEFSVFNVNRISKDEVHEVAEAEEDYTAASEGKKRVHVPRRRPFSHDRTEWVDDSSRAEGLADDDDSSMNAKATAEGIDARRITAPAKASEMEDAVYKDRLGYWQKHADNPFKAEELARADSHKAYNDTLDRNHASNDGSRWTPEETVRDVQEQDEYNAARHDDAKQVDDFLDKGHAHSVLNRGRHDNENIGSVPPASPRPSAAPNRSAGSSSAPDESTRAHQGTRGSTTPGSTASTPASSSGSTNDNAGQSSHGSSQPADDGDNASTSSSSSSNTTRRGTRTTRSHAAGNPTERLDDYHETIKNHAAELRDTPPIGRKGGKISEERVSSSFSGKNNYVLESSDKNRNNTIINDETLKYAKKRKTWSEMAEERHQRRKRDSRRKS